MARKRLLNGEGIGMRMTKESEIFEKQIKRIKDLLVDSNAKVIWNDRIPDPDNPKQQRQIDITVKNKNITTHIECRSRKRPQDTNWIEELLGRKMSLTADKMVAVSFSGFTEGAKKKAKRWGIFLRDICEITEEEINSWGNNSTIRFGLYCYENVVITPIFDIQYKNKINPRAIVKSMSTYDPMFQWFEYVKSAILHNKNTPEFDEFKAVFDLKPNQFTIDSIPIKAVKFEAKVSETSQIIKNTCVLLYAEPDTNAKDRNDRIDQFGFGGFEVTKANGKMSICVDISSIEFPINCQFNGRLIVNQDIGHEIGDICCIGLEQSQLKFNKIAFNVGFETA